MSRQVTIRQFFDIWLRHHTASAAQGEIIAYLEEELNLKLNENISKEIHFILLKIKTNWQRCHYMRERFEEKFGSWLNSPFVISDACLSFVSIIYGN